MYRWRNLDMHFLSEKVAEKPIPRLKSILGPIYLQNTLLKPRFQTHFLFSKKRVFLQTTLLETTLKNTLLLNKKRVFKAWFQKCVL